MTRYPADALAEVTDPALVNFEPALMQDAWFRLMQSRGRPVRRDRLALLEPRHIIQPEPTTPDEPAPGAWVSVDKAIAGPMARTLAFVRGKMAATPDGGDVA